MSIAALLLIACSDDARPRTSTERRSSEPSWDAPSYEEIAVDDAGSIAGRVSWEGPRPEVDVFPVRAQQEVCGDTQPSFALRVSPRGGVRDAVISLIDVRSGRAFNPDAPAPSLVTRRCRYQPHVQVVPLGSRMRFVNEDPILHNVHVFDEAGDTVIDVGLPEQGATVERVLTTEGVLRVVCDAGHGFQQAFLHVSEHPYAVVTDEDGDFRLSDVPPGRYTLRVWHEGWRVVGTERGRPRYSNPILLIRSVSVSPRQETTLDFTLSASSAVIAGD